MSNWKFEQKHPCILPVDARFSELIIGVDFAGPSYCRSEDKVYIAFFLPVQSPRLSI